MKISDYTQKQRWERRIAGQGAFGGNRPRQGNSNEPTAFAFDSYMRELYSQSDFMNELQPSAHLIYDVDYRSNRPQFRYDESLGKNVQTGHEKVERVSVALQAAILRHKATHSFGSPIWFGNEGDSDQTEQVNMFKSYWNSVGMNAAMLEWGRACFGTGDGAIAIYLDENKDVRYKVFSYEKGDIIVGFINPEDSFKRNVVRMFRENGNIAVEIYRSTDVQKWVKGDVNDENFKRWYPNIKGTRSEDGYILVTEAKHGLTQCPVVYHREPDVCWGNVQNNIEDIEKLLSDLMENGKYYNFQMLFVTGIVGGLPNVNFQGKVLAARNKDGDAKILQPADASNTFTLSLQNSFRMLCDSVGAVFIRAEDLRGGDYSGAFLRNLYFPETQWCVEAYARFDHAMRDLISVFKDFVGRAEGEIVKYKGLKISYMITPHIPSNQQEEILNINSSLAAGSISRETAVEESPIASPNEMIRLAADDKRKEEIKVAEDKRKAELNKANQPPNPNPQDNRFVNA